MSKLSNMLLMLIQLQKGGIQSIQSIADLLEVTPRQVRRYRDDLEMSGVYVNSKTGKYGGYYLENQKETLNVKLSNSDYLFSRLFQNEHEFHVTDLYGIYKLYSHEENGLGVFLRNSSFTEIRHHLVIAYAVKTNRRIIVEYASASNVVVNRKLEPYFIFLKYGNIYFAAKDKYDPTIKYYKISRIINITLMTESFEASQNVLEKTREIVESNYGVFYKNELINVSLLCKKSNIEIIKDYFEDSLKINAYDQDYYLVQLQTGSLHEIKHPLLSFGAAVKVLEPKALVETIRDEWHKAVTNYE